MSGISGVVSNVVYWIAVPGILLAVFVLSISIVSRAEEGSARTSATAGFLAGLVIFVVFVASQMGKIEDPSFTFSNLPRIELAPMGIGLAIGFVFLWGVRFIAPTPVVGLLSLMLAAASTLAVFYYFFVESLRSTMLFLTLGAALGALLHVVFFPDSVRDIWD